MANKEQKRRIYDLETEIVISKKLIEDRLRSGSLSPEKKAKLEAKLREALESEEKKKEE
jgi:hypothetical protein